MKSCMDANALVAQVEMLLSTLFLARAAVTRSIWPTPVLM